MLRAGYTLAYNRPGMSDFTDSDRRQPRHLARRDRNHASATWTPTAAATRPPPQHRPPRPAAVFRPRRSLPDDRRRHRRHHDLRPEPPVPYSQTWTAGWQRKLTGDIGHRSALRRHALAPELADLQLQRGQHRRERVPQRVPAGAANLQANIAGRPRQHVRAIPAPPAPSPLPIFLAYFNGLGGGAGRQLRRSTRARAGPAPPSTRSSRRATRTRSHWHGHQRRTPASIDDATRRDNALRAGLPANSSSPTRIYLGGAESSATAATPTTTRCSSSCASGCRTACSSTAATCSARPTRPSATRSAPPRKSVLADRHRRRRHPRVQGELDLRAAVRPGRRFGGSAGPWLDRLIGGWSFDGIARLQSGRMLDFGNVRLVGMTKDELQDTSSCGSTTPAGRSTCCRRTSYDNTLRAFSVSATTATGYSGEAPTGRYIAPANGPDCIEIAPADRLRRLRLEQRRRDRAALVRFDLSAVKRVPIKGRSELRVPRRVPQRLQPPVVRPGDGSRIGSRRLPRRERRHGTAGSTDLAPELVSSGSG